MIAVDYINRLKCKSEVHYTFFIFLAIWCKIYVFDTSFAKDGYLNPLFVFECITVLMGLMYFGTVLMYIGQSSITKYVKYLHFCLIFMLTIYLSPATLLVFTIFHLISLPMESKQ